MRVGFRTFPAMQIGIIGTGNMARALGGGWVTAGHQVRIAGRDAGRTAAAAQAIGASATAPDVLADGCDAVLLAVLWTGVQDALAMVGPGLAGLPLIDPTNAVEHGVGEVLVETSAAEQIAAWAPGGHVVKAFNLYPANQWPADPAAPRATVPLAGDDPGALDTVATLVRDVGGVPVVFGGLARARQLEEAAGFVIGLAFAGTDPRSAVPHVPTGSA